MTEDRDRFEFRLGDSDRDRLISDRLREYARHASASKLIKDLLYAYFAGRLADFGTPAGQSVTDDDPREAAAVAKLMGVSFTNLKD